MTSPAHATDTGTPSGGPGTAAAVAASPVLGPGTADPTGVGPEQPAAEVGTVEVASAGGLVEPVNVAVYRDSETGRVHYASPHSKATKKRLAFGDWVEATDDGAAGEELFDPTKALVRDVLAHLEEHADDTAEVQRVKDAESAGENRVTIASWSPAPDGD